MSEQFAPTVSKGPRPRLGALDSILRRQSENFRVILLWHLGGGLLGGLAGSYLGMYPYDLGATITEVGFLTSVNTLSACVPALIGGALSQKYGRKRLILRIWPSYIAFYLMLMLAPSWFFLIPAYLVFAIAYIGDPALGSLYADSLDEETRAEALSVDSTLSGIASLFMPPVGGFLVMYLGGIGKPDALRAFYGFYVIFHTLTMIYFWRCLQDDGPTGKDESVREALGSLKVVFADGRIRRYLVLTATSSLTAGLSAPFVTIYIFSWIRASPTFIGSMVSLSTGITYLALNLGAWLSDRVGRKALVVASYLLSASTLTALVLADSTAALMPYYILAALTAIGGPLTPLRISGTYTRRPPLRSSRPQDSLSRPGSLTMLYHRPLLPPSHS